MRLTQNHFLVIVVVTSNVICSYVTLVLVAASFFGTNEGMVRRRTLQQQCCKCSIVQDSDGDGLPDFLDLCPKVNDFAAEQTCDTSEFTSDVAVLRDDSDSSIDDSLVASFFFGTDVMFEVKMNIDDVDEQQNQQFEYYTFKAEITADGDDEILIEVEYKFTIENDEIGRRLIDDNSGSGPKCCNEGDKYSGYSLCKSNIIKICTEVATKHPKVKTAQTICKIVDKIPGDRQKMCDWIKEKGVGKLCEWGLPEETLCREIFSCDLKKDNFCCSKSANVKQCPETGDCVNLNIESCCPGYQPCSAGVACPADKCCPSDNYCSKSKSKECCNPEPDQKCTEDGCCNNANLCGTKCCQDGEECIDNACCPLNKDCGDQCCNDDKKCESCGCVDRVDEVCCADSVTIRKLSEIPGLTCSTNDDCCLPGFYECCGGQCIDTKKKACCNPGDVTEGTPYDAEIKQCCIFSSKVVENDECCPEDCPGNTLDGNICCEGGTKCIDGEVYADGQDCCPDETPCGNTCYNPEQYKCCGDNNLLYLGNDKSPDDYVRCGNVCCRACEGCSENGDRCCGSVGGFCLWDMTCNCEDDPDNWRRCPNGDFKCISKKGGCCSDESRCEDGTCKKGDCPCPERSTQCGESCCRTCAGCYKSWEEGDPLDGMGCCENWGGPCLWDLTCD